MIDWELLKTSQNQISKSKFLTELKIIKWLWEAGEMDLAKHALDELVSAVSKRNPMFIYLFTFPDSTGNKRRYWN